MKLQTLDEFLARDRWPFNANLKHPEFKTLYVRKGDIGVVIGDDVFRVTKVVTIGNITAKKPGKGAFTRLVEDLVHRDLAIYVECVHNEDFQEKLLKMGFIKTRVCGGQDYNFLFNYEGHLTKFEE